MSCKNYLWASRFKHIPPAEKFVLMVLGDHLGDREPPELPKTNFSDLPHFADYCNLPIDKFERVLEGLMKRGLIRVAPGPSIELCTFVSPEEWNQSKEKIIEPAGKGAGNGHRS